MKKVTDPNLLAQLDTPDVGGPKKVTDPNLLAQLEGNAPPEPSNPVLDTVSKAVENTPLGMVSRGTNAAMEAAGKVFKPFFPVPDSVQKAVSPIFRGSRAAGVTSASLLTGQETPFDATSPLSVAEGYGRRLIGSKTPQERLSGIKRGIESFNEDFEPRSTIERVGAVVGENAPAVAASVVSPSVGGPLVMGAQQIAETGKVSPMLAVPPLAGAAKRIFRKTASWLGDVPEESIAYKLENPRSIKTAKEITDIASSDVPRVANKFDQVISGLKSAAKEKLSTSSYIEKTATDAGGAFTKDEVLNSVTSARRKLGGVYTPEAENASKTLAKVGEKLRKIRNTVSQNQVADLIDDLDREIPWEKVWKKPEDLTLTDKALIDTRTGLDGILKTKNKEYAKIMKPLSEAIQTRNEYLKTLGVQKVRGEGYVPSDTTTNRLFGATKENRLMTKRVLEKTNETLGENMEPEVRASQVKADFEPESGRSFQGGDRTWRQTLGRPMVKRGLDFMARPEVVPVFKAMGNSGRVMNFLTAQKAQEYLSRAGGDKAKAREMALRDGWRLR